MGFSFTGESKTAKSGNLCKHVNHCIIIHIHTYIYTVYIISFHQVFLVLLLSLFVSPNSQGPEDAGVSALRVFRSFCCAVGLIHWCVPCRLVYITPIHTVSDVSDILCLSLFHPKASAIPWRLSAWCIWLLLSATYDAALSGLDLLQSS